MFEKEKWLEWQDKTCRKVRALKNRDEKTIIKFVKEEFPRANLNFIVGMKRSGNHAISNWFVQNCFESLIYVNNIANEVPDSWHTYKSEYILPRMIDRLILSIEHRPVSDYLNLKPVLIVRDPYNWLASWMSHTHFIPDNLEKDISMYLDNLSQDTDMINFNKWFVSREYRDVVAHKLGITNRDIGINSVTSFGKGSSFDKKSFDGRAQEMKVLRRWENMKDNSLYIETIKKHNLDFELECKNYFKDIDCNQINSFLSVT